MAKVKDFFKTIFTAINKYWRLAGLYALKFFKKYYLIIAMVLVTIVALIARYCFVTYPSGDSVWFILDGWENDIRYMGFSSFWQVDSDYSPIYLFMLALLLLIPDGKQISISLYGTTYTFFENRMIALKTVYFLFTVAAAFAIYLIVKLLTKSKGKGVIAYCITLALPTLFVNSALWGNSDIIYVTFLLYSVYFFLKGTKYSDIFAYMFLGFAFANKMQAIFVMPFVIYFIVRRKAKLYRVIYAFLAFFITLVPCYFCGAGFLDPFAYLAKQFNGYNNLSLGAATIWKFLELQDAEMVKKYATWISVLLVGVMLVIVYFRNIKLEDKHASFKVFFLLTMTTAFVLPRLHERYFLLIEILTIVYAIIDKKKWYLPVLSQVGGAICYYHYMTGYKHYIIESWGEATVTIASVLNLIILGIAFIDVMKLDHKDGFKEDIEQIDSEIKEIQEPKNTENQ